MEKRIVMFPFAQLSMACGLNLWANKGYSVGAAAKSAAGRENPNLPLEPTHAPIAWFFVGARLPFSWVLLAYPAFGILSVMAVRAGQPQGWPVSKVAGFSPLSGLPPMSVRTPGGRDNLTTLEAAIMATVPTLVAPEIQLVNGQAVTTSLALANYFHKRHDNVIAKIESLDCSPEFRLLNFKETVYDRPNPAGGAPIPTPCYLLTRDGFAFVAMGFTGKKAAQFKEAYIGAFNAMEAERQALPALMAQLDQNFLRHTAEQATLDLAHLAGSVIAAQRFYDTIHQHWLTELHPMLLAARSPLADNLNYRFAWMHIMLGSVAHQAGISPAAYGKQGGRHE